MERTENRGNAGFLQAEEHIGDFVDIVYELLISFRACIPSAIYGAGRIGKALGEIKFRIFVCIAGFGIESVNLIARVFPVPSEGRNTALVPQVLGGFESHLRVALVPVIACLHAGSEQEVESHESRIFAGLFVEFGHIGKFFQRRVRNVASHHTGNGFDSVVCGEEVVKLLGAFGRVGVDRGVAHVCLCSQGAEAGCQEGFFQKVHFTLLKNYFERKINFYPDMRK